MRNYCQTIAESFSHLDKKNKTKLYRLARPVEIIA